jgi:hypothetical protein
MLADRVKCAAPSPGTVGVGSTVTLGAAPTGFRTFLAAFGGGASCFFVLSDGAGRAISGVWTVNATTPETATVTQILGNDRLGGTAPETFTGAATAWNAVPAVRTPSLGPNGLQFGGLSTGPYAGFRNLIINGNPIINQRGYVSGAATTGANQYTLDRWRVVVSGQSVSWSDGAGIRTVTAPAGGMEQVIEGASILGGVHTVSWTGTAACTVNGVAVANGGQVTLPGGADATVRMSGGTWSHLQVEPGSVALPFERRPFATEMALCQRYFEAGFVKLWGVATAGAQVIGQSIGFAARKRATPTIALSNSSVVNCVIGTPEPSVTSCGVFATSSAAGSVVFQADFAASAEF